MTRSRSGLQPHISASGATSLPGVAGCASRGCWGEDRVLKAFDLARRICRKAAKEVETGDTDRAAQGTVARTGAISENNCGGRAPRSV